MPRQGNSVLVTVPLDGSGRFAGAVQARFSLLDVHRRLQGAGRLILLYVALYGGVLALAGVYLLGRNVVTPVRRLMATTQRVAAGDLEQTLAEGGPLEIAELSRSFNRMLSALKESRRESEGHIRSLQRANEELRRTQQELIRSEKMASVGHLAAGMAHEIGNPLGALVGYLELLRRETETAELKDIAGRALDESGRIDRLVRDLLDYAAPAPDRPEPVEPVAVLREACQLLHHQGALEGIDLQNRLPDRLPRALIAAHKLQQVLVNLLLNARDAATPAGWVRLEGGTEKEELWLAVTDSGPGISSAALPHIFDPFFTTKDPGKGRGLGLAVCQRVVAEAGGRIDAESVPGEGSRFTVRLPLREGEEREE